jgi:hypothetical protein
VPLLLMADALPEQGLTQLGLVAVTTVTGLAFTVRLKTAVALQLLFPKPDTV